MKQLFICALLFSGHIHSMQSEPSDLGCYTTFLFYTWGPKLYDYQQKHPDDPHMQKLERFKNNYFMAALLYRYLNKCDPADAARQAYRSVPHGPAVLHNLLHGTLDDFEEDNYTDMDLKLRWRDELEYIESQIPAPNP